MKKQKPMFLASALALGFALNGCAGSHKIESSEVPSPPAANESASMVNPVAAQAAGGHYLVERRDCLWTIAEKPGVYGDAFEWPLLFKANRDTIQDPDLIYPNQNLKVDKNYSMETVNHAKQMAMATPKYVPHSRPRSSLPVDYF